MIAVAAGPVAAAAEEEFIGLRLLGLAALIDPLRPEAKDAVTATRHAGIRVVMVTGDHPLTALAIARQLDFAQTWGGRHRRRACPARRPCIRCGCRAGFGLRANRAATEARDRRKPAPAGRYRGGNR